MIKPKLCIGTAQFGQSYGITNQESAIDEERAIQILELANKKNINEVDTASCYGRSQEIVGNAKKRLEMKITSKIKISNQDSKRSEIEAEWNKGLNMSLDKLKINKLNTLLIHDTENINDVKAELFCQWARKQKISGKIERIGVSIYEAKDLNRIPEELAEVVQLPISIYDQRAIEYGTIERLRAMKCQIQIRSIFMQGLLLQQEQNWPEWIDKETRNHHRRYCDEVRRVNSTLLEQAIAFAKEQTYAETILIGISNIKDLEEITKTWEAEVKSNKIVVHETWKIKEKSIVDPRYWPK